MRSNAAELFAEFAAAYVRGEWPEAREYLERAGREAEELAQLLQRFLQGVPAPDATAEDAALLGAWLQDEPPLLELRRRKGLRVDEVVDRLVAALGIDPARRARVKRQYQRLEGGALDPAGVTERVWGALTETLGDRSRELARAWSPPPAPATTYFRAEAPAATPAAIDTDADEEIDRLFTGAADS